MAVKMYLIIYINTQNVHWIITIYSIVVENDVKVFRIDIFDFKEHFEGLASNELISLQYIFLTSHSRTFLMMSILL